MKEHEEGPGVEGLHGLLETSPRMWRTLLPDTQVGPQGCSCCGRGQSSGLGRAMPGHLLPTLWSMAFPGGLEFSLSFHNELPVAGAYAVIYRSTSLSLITYGLSSFPTENSPLEYIYP